MGEVSTLSMSLCFTSLQHGSAVQISAIIIMQDGQIFLKCECPRESTTNFILLISTHSHLHSASLQHGGTEVERQTTSKDD